MKRIFFIMVVGLFSLPLWAQESLGMDSAQSLLNGLLQQRYTSRLTLSVADAQQFAVTQNRSLQNASLDVKKAHAQRWQTIAAMLPQVDASGQYINMCGYEMEFGGTGQKIVMPDYITGGASASIGLNGQAVVAVLLNNIAIEMQDITRAQSEADLIANVTESYAAVLVMEDIVVLMDSSLKNVQQLAEQTDRMAAVGAVEQTQADQVHVRVNQLRNSVMANRRNLQLAYNTLRVLLDVDSETELQLTTTLDEMLSPENTLGVMLQSWNINNNFNYQLLCKNVELAKKNVHLAAWAYGPTIGAQYTYTYRHNLSDGGFNMTPPNMIAVSLSMPIWSSGKRAAGVHEKRIALKEAENTLSETKDNLGIQFQQLRYNLANAYETYMTQRENIEVSSRVFQNVGNKYQWGATSALELTNASNDLITAQTSYVNAVLDVVNAQVKLEKFLNNK
ncbi:MAG: TolC family protein [Paludibacteraceae bacterium]|nr:TolC family protein [Paludibacteraceae bacterium]